MKKSIVCLLVIAQSIMPFAGFSWHGLLVAGVPSVYAADLATEKQLMKLFSEIMQGIRNNPGLQQQAQGLLKGFQDAMEAWKNAPPNLKAAAWAQLMLWANKLWNLGGGKVVDVSRIIKIIRTLGAGLSSESGALGAGLSAEGAAGLGIAAGSALAVGLSAAVFLTAIENETNEQRKIERKGEYLVHLLEVRTKIEKWLNETGPNAADAATHESLRKLQQHFEEEYRFWTRSKQIEEDRLEDRSLVEQVMPWLFRAVGDPTMGTLSRQEVARSSKLEEAFSTVSPLMFFSRTVPSLAYYVPIVNVLAALIRRTCSSDGSCTEEVLANYPINYTMRGQGGVYAKLDTFTGGKGAIATMMPPLAMATGVSYTVTGEATVTGKNGKKEGVTNNQSVTVSALSESMQLLSYVFGGTFYIPYLPDYKLDLAKVAVTYTDGSTAKPQCETVAAGLAMCTMASGKQTNGSFHVYTEFETPAGKLEMVDERTLASLVISEKMKEKLQTSFFTILQGPNGTYNPNECRELKERYDAEVAYMNGLGDVPNKQAARKLAEKFRTELYNQMVAAKCPLSPTITKDGNRTTASGGGSTGTSTGGSSSSSGTSTTTKDPCANLEGLEEELMKLQLSESAYTEVRPAIGGGTSRQPRMDLTVEQQEALQKLQERIRELQQKIKECKEKTFAVNGGSSSSSTSTGFSNGTVLRDAVVSLAMDGTLMTPAQVAQLQPGAVLSVATAAGTTFVAVTSVTPTSDGYQITAKRKAKDGYTVEYFLVMNSQTGGIEVMVNRKALAYSLLGFFAASGNGIIPGLRYARGYLMSLIIHTRPVPPPLNPLTDSLSDASLDQYSDEALQEALQALEAELARLEAALEQANNDLRMNGPDGSPQIGGGRSNPLNDMLTLPGKMQEIKNKINKLKNYMSRRV